MTRNDVLALAARVEAATGADRELDAQIAATLRIGVGPPDWALRWSGEWRATPQGSVILIQDDGNPGSHFMAAYYTRSLDVALSLVPSGYAMGFKRAPCQRSHAMLATIGEEHNASGATPPLALTAAALRAKAERMPE